MAQWFFRLCFLILTEQDRIATLKQLKRKNIDLYEHFGFELMESAKLPDSELTVYSMLRKAKNKCNL